MKKTIKIFYSWQSDYKKKKIKEVFDSSIEKVKNHFKNKYDIIICQDSRSESGMVDISSTIFNEINNSDLFVGDLSIVSFYENAETTKFLPNVNVVYELGYATSRLGQERVLCFFDSESGDMNKLPFDLRNKRILKISTKNEEDINKTIGYISNAIIKALTNIENNNSSNFYNIGFYDLSSKKILSCLYPLDIESRMKLLEDSLVDAILKRVNSIKKVIEKESRLKEQIKALQTNKIQKNNSMFGDIKESLSSVALPADTFNHSVNFEDEKRKIIISVLNELHIEVNESFFETHTLYQSNWTMIDSTIYGDENEKERYFELNDLYDDIYYYKNFKWFKKCIEGYIFIPVAIQNISNNFDKDIDVVITSSNCFLNSSSEILRKNINLIDDEFYKETLINGLFHFSVDENISDTYEYPNILEIESMSYEDKLALFESYIYCSRDNFIKLHVDSCKVKEIKYLPKYISIKKENAENIILNISIKSIKTNLTKQIMIKIK